MRRLPLFMLAACLSLGAQDRPDFSGTWKLNVDESDFAGHTPPQSRTDIIRQTTGTLQQDVTEMDHGHERASQLTYKLDGTGSKNTVEGNPMDSVAQWDVTDLTIHSTTHGPKGDSTIDDRWIMSLDKRKITIRRHFENHGIQSDEALVEYKQ